MKRNVHQPTDTVKCTGLDPAWNKLTTKMNFPINKGTELTVSCEEGFKLSGSNTVTCTEGTTFSTDTTPTCTQGKRAGRGVVMAIFALDFEKNFVNGENGKSGQNGDTIS